MILVLLLSQNCELIQKFDFGLFKFEVKFKTKNIKYRSYLFPLILMAPNRAGAQPHGQPFSAPLAINNRQG
jgi:hypothetical protein